MSVDDHCGRIRRRVMIPGPPERKHRMIDSRTEHSQVVLITGATDGLGRALAGAALAGGATVLVHGRSEERIAQTVEELGGGDRVRGYRADLSSLAEVRRLADEVLAAEPRLDVLVNNAGIGADVPGGGARMESADGYELRFAVNYLAGYLLTRRLLDLLRRSAPSRIVNVSSAGQAALDFDDLMLRHGYSGVRAYCQSKLAQILFTVDLTDELAGSGVIATCLHPATYMPTKIVSSPISTIEEGVDATMRLVTAPPGAIAGRYFNGSREARADAQAYDAGARARLRELSEELTSGF
jgi:NAD(P)-dependent dehydrogenase (short-subunit alcohol dehydrogenase family)